MGYHPKDRNNKSVREHFWFLRGPVYHTLFFSFKINLFRYSLHRVKCTVWWIDEWEHLYIWNVSIFPRGPLCPSPPILTRPPALGTSHCLLALRELPFSRERFVAGSFPQWHLRDSSVLGAYPSIIIAESYPTVGVVEINDSDYLNLSRNLFQIWGTRVAMLPWQCVSTD